MRNLIWFLAILSFPIFGQQPPDLSNIDNMNKKMLRIMIRGIVDSYELKLDNYTKVITDLSDSNVNLEEDLNNNKKELEQYIQLYNELSKESVFAQENISILEREVSKLSEVEQELFKCQDSIDVLNTILFEERSSDEDAPFIEPNARDFLNRLYLGETSLNNQSFNLIPAGIIANSEIVASSFDRYESQYSEQDLKKVSQFFKMSELNFSIQNRIKRTKLSSREAARWKDQLKRNIKKYRGQEFYKMNTEIFPKFSFLEGKLVTVKANDSSKDFLFSVKEINLENEESQKSSSYNRYGYNGGNSNANYYEEQGGPYSNRVINKKKFNFSGRKPIFFSLTDDKKQEFLFNIILIDNQAYLAIDEYSLNKIGWNYNFTPENNIQAELIKMYGPGSESKYNIDDDFDSPLCNDRNDSRYIPCDDREYFIEQKGVYLSAVTKKTKFRRPISVNPIYILFKLI